jgi:hypothetical protein
MTPFNSLAAAAALASLALPATASAHRHASPASVAAHVRSADLALHRVRTLVARRQPSAAAAQLARNRRETRAALSEARRLRRGSHSKVAVASVFRLVATQENDNAESFARLVDEVSGRLQVEVAQSIGNDVDARENALALLASLVDQLPAGARDQVARAIAALSSDGHDVVASLTQALESVHVPGSVKDVLETVLAQAASAVNAGLDRLRALAGDLPAEAQTYVNAALDELTRLVPDITGMLAGLFSAIGEPPSTGGSSTPGGLSIPDWLHALGLGRANRG